MKKSIRAKVEFGKIKTLCNKRMKKGLGHNAIFGKKRNQNALQQKKGLN